MENYLEENKKKRKKLAFTLVELLAVIVILAIILVIAVPRIMDTITKSRRASIESSAKLVARSIETNYQISLAKGEGETLSTSGSCMNLADIDTLEYKACTYTIDEKGKAKVNLEGTDDGKFSQYVCCGATTSTAECTTLVTDISACPGVVAEDEDEEELVYTPEACFTTTNVTGGVEITKYNIGKITGYEIDADKCYTAIYDGNEIILESDITTVCAGGTAIIDNKELNMQKYIDMINNNNYSYIYGESTNLSTVRELVSTGAIKNLTYTNDCTNKIVIPETIGGKDVVSVGERAFSLACTVTYDNNASSSLSFMSCFATGYAIVSVTLPSKLKTIGEKAFDSNYLTTINIPDSVVSLGEGAFSGNVLTSVTLGKGITSLTDNVFTFNSDLTRANVTKKGTTKISVTEYTFPFTIEDDDPDFEVTLLD